MRVGAVAGIGCESIGRIIAPSRAISRSRTTLATMEAAAIEAMCASPLMIASTLQGRRGGSLPSTSAMSGVQGRAAKRPAHGEKRGLADVDRVDRPHGRSTRCPTWAVARISANSVLPRLRRQGLRIGKARGHPLEVEHDGRRDDGPGQRPAPDLVEPGDAGEARRASSARSRLEAEIRRPGG